jgi:hypothetical protein
MTPVQEVENTILEALRDYISSYSKRLSELGLAYQISIERRSSEGVGYRSEARAEFIDENGPCDILEFEVVKQGSPVVSVDDVKKWLPDAFASVVSRRELEAGDQNRPESQHKILRIILGRSELHNVRAQQSGAPPKSSVKQEEGGNAASFCPEGAWTTFSTCATARVSRGQWDLARSAGARVIEEEYAEFESWPERGRVLPGGDAPRGARRGGDQRSHG